MPSDIFISYSRKDSVPADALTEKLRADGMTVWIDKEGLELAASWSREIVDAIESSKAFLILLSEHSLVSKNVIRELSIASDCGRGILPIEVKHVRLTSDFKYALAGLQRSPIENYDGILKALKKLGIGPYAGDMSPIKTLEPRAVLETRPSTDTRKSLIVFPFRDLSPAKDHEWFADGLTEELIDTLSQIKSIRLIGRKTAQEFRSFQGAPQEIAKDFQVRYFIEGSVRRADQHVKITAQLFDVEADDYLATVSHKGLMDDIFAIQEDVARKVAAALELRLTTEESKQLGNRGTTNSEAFELFLEAKGSYAKQSQESISLAIEMTNAALALDPHFLSAIVLRASCRLDLYRLYHQDESYVATAERELLDVLAVDPNHIRAHGRLSFCYQLQGRIAEAEAESRKAIEMDPNSEDGYFSLGYLYYTTGQPAQAALAFEQALRIDNSGSHRAYFNLCQMYAAMENEEQLRDAGKRAVPSFERWIKLHPNDFYESVSFCAILRYAGREQEALALADKLRHKPEPHGKAFYNLACFYLELQDKEHSLECLSKALDAGFRGLSLVREWTRYHLFTGDPKLAELISRLESIVEPSNVLV